MAPRTADTALSQMRAAISVGLAWMSAAPDKLEAAENAVFGFVWHWFCRLLFWCLVGLIWCVVGLFGLYAVFAVIYWAGAHPERWAFVVIGGLLGMCCSALFDMRRLLVQIVNQNAQLLARTRRTPTRPQLWDDLADDD